MWASQFKRDVKKLESLEESYQHGHGAGSHCTRRGGGSWAGLAQARGGEGGLKAANSYDQGAESFLVVPDDRTGDNSH